MDLEPKIRILLVNDVKRKMLYNRNKEHGVYIVRMPLDSYMYQVYDKEGKYFEAWKEAIEIACSHYGWLAMEIEKKTFSLLDSYTLVIRYQY